MSQIIERMARAIAYAESLQNDSGVMPKWSDYRDHARAALESLMEPTDAMLEVGMDYDERELEIRFGRPPTVEECQRGEWQAMITEAMR